MFHVLLAVGVLSLGSCRKQNVVNLTPNPHVTAPPIATPEAVVSPPLPNAEKAPIAAVARHKEYFLRAATSVQTAKGLVSFQPGTRLRQVGPGTYTAQGQTLTLRDDQVTDDLKLARQPTVTNQSVQTGLGRERQVPPSDLAPLSPEIARQLSADPQYQALSERATTIRSKIERVSREASRFPTTDEKAPPAATALKQEREKLEGELRAITEEQKLLRTSK